MNGLTHHSNNTIRNQSHQQASPLINPNKFKQLSTTTQQQNNNQIKKQLIQIITTKQIK